MSAETEIDRSGAAVAQRPLVHSVRRPLVMCVDDDVNHRRIAKTVVEQSGYAFVGLSSGAECLTMLHRVKPRIILMDIMMPEMDGYETCRRIRLNFRLVLARIIYVSALNSLEDISRALGSDADDYIVKPYTAERLRDRIQHWLREGPREPDT